MQTAECFSGPLDGVQLQVPLCLSQRVKEIWIPSGTMGRWGSMAHVYVLEESKGGLRLRYIGLRVR